MLGWYSDETGKQMDVVMPKYESGLAESASPSICVFKLLGLCNMFFFLAVLQLQITSKLITSLCLFLLNLFLSPRLNMFK